MDSGVRIEVRIESPEECPVATVSETVGTAAGSISWTEEPNSDRAVEEFVLESPAEGSASLPTSGTDSGSGSDSDSDPDLDLDPDSAEPSVPIQSVFADESRAVYRFERDRDRTCPCEVVEGFGYPVADADVRDGTLFVAFHVPEMAAIRPILERLRARFGGMSVERIVRSETDPSDATLVHVDRDTLTDRQIEVLETAIEMDYFEHPKGANAGDVADELGINRATFAEHLAAAQRKLLPPIVGEH
ncbi:helix-turn-helix domain-containing protein [Halobiforma nitratireducens]|uniref:Bacterio-opsin activator HTH domain-containing protein n=1 Tax=Halobiforma nitratireducens JCM 10879 TaxID=1227454 RepID=M0LTE0_9EURY|nr:helix-turn-helix domain-containing protein [Halobiforma nitratireducens]EMA35375.1 bacterio-opsin activator HTH domain-containing protein [Halobiforma nitratireducens JCM 10879]